MITKVSMLVWHLELPREGHLAAVHHIYAYLRKKHNSRICFDPNYPDIDKKAFKKCDWKSFYGDMKEAISPNATGSKGKYVNLRLFVNSDHSGDGMARRSRTAFFVFLNMAPIIWFSKWQPTVETFVFGSKFAAMKIVWRPSGDSDTSCL